MLCRVASPHPDMIAPYVVNHPSNFDEKGRHTDSPKKKLREEMVRAGLDPSYSMPTLFMVREGVYVWMMNHVYGLKVDDAAEAFAIKMLGQHPEGSVSNGVLVSVSRANARRTAALGEAVSEGLRRAAAFVQIEPAILLQHVEGESGLSALTKAVAERSAGIDLGTAENLSVQDLLYAVESQSLQWDDASLSGTLINWRCANGSDAEQIAASYVGAVPDQFLTMLSVYSDQLAYSVRFSDGNQWNNYWVSAATGEILNPDSWRPAPSADAAQTWTPQTGQSYDLPDPTDFIQNRRQIHDFVNFIDWLF